MATIKISKNTTVADLKQQFNHAVSDAKLRVFNGGKIADDKDILVDFGAKTGEITFHTNRTVGKFVQAMKDELNVKVKVRTADDWVTVLDGVTLAKVKELPKQSTKTAMEDFIGYQRDENDNSESDKTDSATKTVKTKKMHFNLYTYYNELQYFKVPKDQQQNLIDFLENADEDEITDALSTVASRSIFQDGDLSIGGNEPDLLYSFANPYEELYIRGDDDDIFIDDFGTRTYNFITINPDKTVTMNIPKNCPDWLVDSYIKPLCKFAEKYIADEDNSDIDFSDPETIDNLTFQIINESKSEPWGDLTMDNYDHTAMMIGIDDKVKGSFEFEIEIPENEKFDPSKLYALFFSNNEVQFLNEIDAIPLFGLVYDDTYYPMDNASGDYKDQNMWVTDPEGSEPLWPSYDE